MRKLGGALHKGANNLMGGLEKTVKTIGKSADEISDIGTDIGNKVGGKNAAIDAKIEAHGAYKKARRNPASEDVVSQAIKLETEAKNATAFTVGGKKYVTMPDGSYMVQGGKKGKLTAIDEDAFSKARGDYAKEQAEIGTRNDFDTAYKNATSGPDDKAGIEFIQNHPGVAAAMAGGIGLAGGALLLGSDDDEYEE